MKGKFIIPLTAVVALIFFLFSRSGYIPLAQGVVIDSILIIKSRNTMMVFEEGRLLNEYSVAIGRQASGAKEKQGDQKTPEGLYSINDRNSRSSFYKNLGVSYPNKTDQRHAERMHVSPGGQIKIHGLKNGFGWIGRWHRLFSWTNGCVAITNREMEDLFHAVAPNAAVLIVP